MRGQPPLTGAGSPGPESYARLLLNLASVLGLVLIIAVTMYTHPGPGKPAPATAKEPAEPAGPVSLAVASPPSRSQHRLQPAAPEQPPVPAAKPLDRAAVAAAEAALDEASRDRARAEARLTEAQRLLAAATLEAEAAAASSRKLAYRVRDPSAQLTRISQQGGFVRAERDRLKDEVAALRRAPRPKVKSIVDRNPVAKPAAGDEYHFEIRRNRVTFIDLERLLKLVKADAQLRVRLAENSRVIESHVGPVGSFSLEYVLRRGPLVMEDLIERRGFSFDLRGWELIPEYEGRGEPYETTRQPFSEYARTINRLSNEHATITMWVYPDGFPLYRKLRDDLHARSFIVAARPLPEGMSIKGSPGGSLSAAQ
jgi:hypothetical protein